MKILYGIQTTGNGHIARALSMVPVLQRHVQVDVLVSGYQSDISLPFPIRYKHHGVSYIFGNHGGIDYLTTMRLFRPYQLWRAIQSCPVRDYDLIVSDFEPITAWAARSQGVPSVGYSHQAAFLSINTPRPRHRVWYAEAILQHFAPTSSLQGVHYQAYDHFIHTPVIRSAVRALTVEDGEHITVYLPAYNDRLLIDLMKTMPMIKWEVFSKKTKYPYSPSDHIAIHPISEASFLESFACARGVLFGAGFSATSEALYLGKRLMAVPMPNQYEQVCNAVALEQLGVTINQQLTKDFSYKILNWLQKEPVHIDFPNNIDQIAHAILRGTEPTI